ncbi:MAG: flagellar biosis protein FliO [Sphingomonas bacterium]|jgi:flagellar protein FliO/FliZ|nr:flagellar biosynthetic protein FliO [Sphingomonas bacterium]MDB5688231.1 flagellar biosis protein FliO [Sphingomonas bacterium]
MSTAGYILNLVLMLALVAGMAVGALVLWRKVQPGMAFGRRDPAVKLVDAIPLGTTGRLAVVDFAGKRLLLAVSRGRIEKIAETDAPVFSLDPAEDR